MFLRTSKDCSDTSNPHTEALPDVCGRKQVIIFIMVLLPAPFGPRKPTTSPLFILNDTSSSAFWVPYILVRCSTITDILQNYGIICCPHLLHYSPLLCQLTDSSPLY